MLSDVVAEGGEETLRMVKQAGAEAHFMKSDVSKMAEVEALVAKIIATWGRMDCAFNNAGIDGKMARLAECTEETWNRTIAVNLTGVFFCMKAEIPHMLRQGGGAIVNTASAAAFYGSHSLAAYGISKAGLVALTRYVATAYGERGIRCNAVAPGVVVDRDAQAALGGPMGDRLRRYSISHVIGRLGYPEEIASAVAFLASDDAAFVTGEVLRVDGGFTSHSPTYATDREASEGRPAS
jgi:NAD(P)-dependent dehydrogenase (short-subunit alcohol dehydrogenase family)